MENNKMIEVTDLSKDYHVVKKEAGLSGAIKGLFMSGKQTIKAVSHVDLSVDKGEIIAVIGPNGAGKSSLIKMMTGVLTPTGGQVLINGKDITKNRKEVVKNIGVVFGQRTQLNWDLRLGESFELLRHIYEIDRDEYEKNLEVMDEILGIKEIINKPVRQMSLGQRVKGDLVAAMLHSPEVLFLDEPTIGLDVNTKFALRKFIKEINRVNKTTIVLTTHDLGDIEELCERLIIINHGKIIEDGNLLDITDRIAPYKTLVVEYYDDENIPTHENSTLDKVEGNVARYRFMKNDITAAALIAELSNKKKMKDVAIEEVGIDEIIRIAYGQ